MYKYFILFVCQFLYISSFAEKTLFLDSEKQEWIVENNNILILKTSEENIPIDSIINLPDSDFTALKSFVNTDPNATYWLKFKIDQENKLSNKWVLEILDSRHYSVELYTILPNGSYSKQRSGINQPFSKREYFHKNFVFDLQLLENTPTTFYLKFTPRTIGSFIFKISSIRSFVSYAFNEYYGLGAFYGILFIIFIFNIIFYFSLKEKIYLFYAFYILTWAWGSMIDDGTGHQYVWPNNYIFTDIGIRSSKLFLLTFFLLYVRYFFLDQQHNIFSYKIFWISIGTYIVVFISSQLFHIHPFIQFLFFIFPFVMIQIYSIRFYQNGYKPARFFILGNFFVLMGFIIRAVMDLNLFTIHGTWGIIFNYSRNLGVLFDIGMLFIALGDRFKYLRLQKEIAQQKAIEQLQENELLSQKVNRELEEKVQVRTQSLSEKTEELNLLNKKLEDQAVEINRWNALLDKDNHVLKQKVNKELEARLKAEETTFEDFLKIFPDDLSCERYIEDVKWKNGYECKKCGNHKFSKGNKTFARRCTKCGYNESVTAFTLFHKCKFPITKAFYIVTKVKAKGEDLNCAELGRELSMRNSSVWDFKNRILESISNTEKSIDFWILNNIK